MSFVPWVYLSKSMKLGNSFGQPVSRCIASDMFLFQRTRSSNDHFYHTKWQKNIILFSHTFLTNKQGIKVMTFDSSCGPEQILKTSNNTVLEIHITNMEATSAILP